MDDSQDPFASRQDADDGKKIQASFRLPPELMSAITRIVESRDTPYKSKTEFAERWLKEGLKRAAEEAKDPLLQKRVAISVAQLETLYHVQESANRRKHLNTLRQSFIMGTKADREIVKVNAREAIRIYASDPEIVEQLKWLIDES